MKSFKPKGSKGPEAIIRDDIINDILVPKGWYCKITHGNMFQSGFPDVYACHMRYGARWIEVKNPGKYAFTTAQLKDFPMMNAHGVGVWVLVAATEEEYKKLFQPQNWWQYLSIMK